MPQAMKLATSPRTAALTAVRLAILLACWAAASVVAAQDASPAGRWEGSVSVPGSELKIAVTLRQAGGAAWNGTIDIPAQGARNMPLGDVTVDGSRVSFALPAVPGAPTFTGTVSSDASSITGTFTQAGQSFPFKLERRADPDALAQSAFEGFDDFVRGAMKSWGVPGLAIAVVKDGQVVLAKGYGVRNIEKSLAVTPDTIFAIGSSTKAFTTMAMGMLVEEGKLAWDEPVTTYLPRFRLKDEVAGKRMTPRDLVTHRSGLPRHDLVWYNAKLSRQDLVDRLPYLEPNEDFREKFQYQNLMFLTAGHLTATVAGVSWEEVLRTRILDPIGMTHSNFAVTESQKSQDFAAPYTLKDKTAIDVPFRVIDTMGPAGSINASVNDMARWVQLNLSGTVEGKRIVAARQLAELHRPQMVIQAFPGLFEDPEIQQPSYGLGWFIESYRGRKRVHHGGNIDGFSAMVALMPDDGLGVVVLSNLNGTPLPTIVARHATDRMLRLEPIDWNGRALKRREVGEKANEAAKKSAGEERKSGTKPAHPLDEYAGEYEHPAYGVVAVRQEGAALTAQFHDIPMRLNHWHYETFRGDVEDKSLSEVKLFFQFFTDGQGEVDRLTVPFEPAVEPISFRKRPPARLTDAAFLGQLAGDYAMVDNPAFKMSVTLTGSALSLTLPGQAPIELEPAHGSSFRLKGLSGFAARFVLEAGNPTTLKVIQPNGVFTLAKVSR
ncbi:MAG TPA: serine hydrolase [Vicinamibacterales bacterium]|nr:serine hydrolase [Vicinamibacterales bacterium]